MNCPHCGKHIESQFDRERRQRIESQKQWDEFQKQWDEAATEQRRWDRIHRRDEIWMAL